MKTGKEWFALLPKEVQAKVKKNWEQYKGNLTWDYEMNREESTLEMWLICLFVFEKTPEKENYWWEIIKKYETK